MHIKNNEGKPITSGQVIIMRILHTFEKMFYAMQHEDIGSIVGEQKYYVYKSRDMW